MATTHIIGKGFVSGAEVKVSGGVQNPGAETKIADGSGGAETKSSPALATVSGEIGNKHSIDKTPNGSTNVGTHTPIEESV